MWIRPLVALAMAVLVAGCNSQTGAMLSQRAEPASDRSFSARDRSLLERAPYAPGTGPSDPIFRRHIVDYPRADVPGSIIVDPSDRFLYYVLPGNKAIRYGVTVGDESAGWSGSATVGRLAEWPDWRPTDDLRRRIRESTGVSVGTFVSGGPLNPLGARGIYLYQNGRDTLYRIHGTNQPQYIGYAVSAGCIRMTNEDVIDLFSRVKVGDRVVVLPEGESIANVRSVQQALLARENARMNAELYGR
jgi:lipoprotein-anchoring transpeptidase ErfK/SrfK